MKQGFFSKKQLWVFLLCLMFLALFFYSILMFTVQWGVPSFRTIYVGFVHGSLSKPEAEHSRSTQAGNREGAFRSTDKSLANRPHANKGIHPDKSKSSNNVQPEPLTTRAQAKPASTEPPFIGDKYSQEDTRSSDCPDNIPKKVLKSTLFKDKFLETVPILQWKKHATEKEYSRLKLYNGAHGWSVVPFDGKSIAAGESLDLLNTTANQEMLDDWGSRANRPACVRCAVVGNGGILKGSQKGKEIDRHDYVFRTNGAVIEGFEKDVGSRTSFYTFSANTLRNSMLAYSSVGFRGPPKSEETRFIFLPDHDRDYLLLKAAVTHTPVKKGPEQSKSPPTQFGKDVRAEKFKMYHPDFIRYIRNRFLRAGILTTGNRDYYRPSTGATMLLAAVHTCDQVSAYGFMTSNYAKFSDHYYDDIYREVIFYINHDLKMEMRLWQQLHEAGIIQLYMRE
ncbi:alpha-N-acetylgalactosaminide alpha-2,6-sialyltransferase 2 [Acipenser oxyrinchus oxyrinchus]|uniref:alpha-N-acetylgalactosaminide alpha-2,6-sialyltransferase n=1 Tax=Acipenser oxyrinchus oxyrinchus TaxID=40147 RepID=A0AAD8G342_ACIOX|nr:alpha-N-acetylgalactosaminide alpha-2,6-sialyltransferase 2 [Acipenser oxyrinchus oxyrinchus]